MEQAVNAAMPVINEFSSSAGFLGLAYLTLFVLIVLVLIGSWRRERIWQNEQAKMREALERNTNVVSELCIYIKALNGSNKK